MFAIVRNDDEVLSTVDRRPAWLSMGVTLATDWRYAVTFETRLGANKSALMHGAHVHTIGDWDDTGKHRKIDDGGLRADGCGPQSDVRIQGETPHRVGSGGPARPVSPGDAGAVRSVRADGGGPRADVAPVTAHRAVAASGSIHGASVGTSKPAPYRPQPLGMAARSDYRQRGVDARLSAADEWGRYAATEQ